MNEVKLRVGSPFRYDGKFPQFSLPLEIGCFSIDAKGKYWDDGRELKYLSMPPQLDDLRMDLNEGFHDYIYPIKDSDYNCNMRLKWILSHEDDVKKHFVGNAFTGPNIDFVCERGLLAKISSTVYEKIEDWMIYATKFRSVIYLFLIMTDKEIEFEGPATDQQIRMSTLDFKSDQYMVSEPATDQEIRRSTWGFKFEQYMVSDSMYSKPDTSVPVNENEKYFAVFKGKLEHHRFLFSAEMDGVDPKDFIASGYDETSPLRYIELKTSKIITSERQKRNFLRYKLLRWHLQSFLGGTPKVICGFRDDEAVVRKLEIFNVIDMPKLAGNVWSPAACLNFTSQFLDFVKLCVTKEGMVYEFYWEPGSDITCEELDSHPGILPEWYTSKVTVI